MFFYKLRQGDYNMKANSLVFNNKIYKDVYSIEKTILYLAIIFCFEQGFLLRIDIGLFTLNLYRIFFLLLCSFFLIHILFNRGKLDISNIRVKKYILFLYSWFFYAIFSLIWVVVSVGEIGEAIFAIIYLFIGVSIVFFEVFYFKNLSDFKQLYNILLFVLLAMIGLGFWNCITGHHLSEYWNSVVYERARFVPVAVFSGQNDYAVYLSLNIPFILVFVRYRKNIVEKFFGVMILFSALYLLVQTLSRGNYIAFIIEIGFWFIFLMKLKTKYKMLILVVLFALISYIAFFEYIQNIFETIIIQMKTLNFGDSSINIRINLIRNSFFLLVKSIGFGVGAGNAVHCMKNFAIYDTRGIPYIHNWWIKVLVEYGILIFIGYIMFYLNIIFNLYKLYFTLNSNSEKMICEALLMVLVSLTVIGFNESPIMALKIWWIYIGFALSFLNYCKLKYKQKTYEHN